jgi:hypothetical protein
MNEVAKLLTLSQDQLYRGTSSDALATLNILALSWRHFLRRHRVAFGEDRADLWPNLACERACRGPQLVS